MAKQATYLKDYQEPDYFVKTVSLAFNLQEDYTEVMNTMQIIRNPKVNDIKPLTLDGENLTLISVELEGKKLSKNECELNETSLTLYPLENEFTVKITTHIKPRENTALTGLYQTNNLYCTQCESHGFRRITYYIDRPDVMAKFTTYIEGNKTKYPILLSNGNLIEKGELKNDRHWVRWDDPFKKPSYLFALVAGDLDCLKDTFVTCTGREIELSIFCEKGKVKRCNHAMQALKKAMRWDEEVYGREYDLDVFMIVAVQDFNMGAMENKGLNIFNDKYILADNATATDDDFAGIDTVVAHEYFHNWTGNRITCRDWFQLSLKEGLTVFRDQSFSADMTSLTVSRIKDVNLLRSVQFPEDAGPLAHPVRPESYLEMNNFYTATIYNKGAEVIRMQHTLLGREGFRKGMDLYFDRHDGQAVTCDDFVQCMEDANQVDLEQFRLWYSQAGTPLIKVKDHYSSNTKEYTLTLEQAIPDTPGQTNKKPMFIPIKMGLLSQEGDALHYEVLALKEAKQQYVFKNIEQKPIPSLLRGFSSPVKLDYHYSIDDLMHLIEFDTDGFNRWEAMQRLMCRLILEGVKQKELFVVPEYAVELFDKLLRQDTDDLAFLSLLLRLPNEAYLAEQMEEVDPLGIHSAREFLLKALAQRSEEALFQTYKSMQTKAYHYDQKQVGERALKNTCLSYLMYLSSKEAIELAEMQFDKADNMTDKLAALTCLANTDTEARKRVFQEFYGAWKNDSLVLDKWFTAQGCSNLPGTFSQVQSLLEHKDFTYRNPNRVRSLIGAFTRSNPGQFHQHDGKPYQFLAEQIIYLDTLNPQIAARMLEPLTRWKRFIAPYRTQMQQALKIIQEEPKLSPDVLEIVTKSLSS